MTTIDLSDTFVGGPWNALTCPTCRAVVQCRPNNAFIIDQIVSMVDEAVRKFEGRTHIVVEGVNEELMWDKYFHRDAV